MASERQIAANRRNAVKSAGPKTAVGKRRSSTNAVRHGLSRRFASEPSDVVEALGRAIVGENADDQILERAVALVEARLDLLRIREMKADLFQRMYVTGRFGPRPPVDRATIASMLKQSELLTKLKPIDPDMPLSKHERTIEAVQRLLPELERVARYERRAFNVMHRALRDLEAVWLKPVNKVKNSWKT